MTLYFSDEVDEHGTFAKIGDMVDGVVPHDKYIDEMFAMNMSQIDGIVQPKLASPFDLFGVFWCEIFTFLFGYCEIHFQLGAVVFKWP